MAALAASAQRRPSSRGVARYLGACTVDAGPVVGAPGVGVGPEAREPGRVAGIQRARLLSALGQVVSERGAANLTVAQVVERSGVSRRTFYGLFADIQDCLLAAMEDALRRVRERVLDSWSAEGDWRERARLCLVELLWCFEEDPVAAQLLIVESLASDHRVLELRARAIDNLIDALDESAHHELREGGGDTRLAAESAVGGVLGVLHARLSRPAPGALVELVGPLMSILVLPYQGAGAAKRALSQPAPAPRRGRESDARVPMQADPFKDAGMRLTYRTARVLAAIAEQPGSSNRQIGDLAGISDQGQVSKLLARLDRIGMIANEGEGHTRGEPNSWSLTAAGDQMSRNLRIRAERGQADAR